MVSVVEILVLVLFSGMIIGFAVMGYKTWRGDKDIYDSDEAFDEVRKGLDADEEDYDEGPVYGGGLIRKYRRIRKFGIFGLLLITILVTTFGTSTYGSIIRALNDL